MFKLKDIFFFFKSTLWGSPSFDSKIVLDSLGKIIKKKKKEKEQRTHLEKKKQHNTSEKKKELKKKSSLAGNRTRGGRVRADRVTDYTTREFVEKTKKELLCCGGLFHFVENLTLSLSLSACDSSPHMGVGSSCTCSWGDLWV